VTSGPWPLLALAMACAEPLATPPDRPVVEPEPVPAEPRAMPPADGDAPSWQRKVVAALDLSPGMVVAELSTGPGPLRDALAGAVGDDGRVVPLRPRDRMPPPSSLDRIVVVDAWRQLPEPSATAHTLRDALRPGGKLVVVDVDAEALPETDGVRPLPPEEVSQQVAGAGLRLNGRLSLPRQYVLVYTPVD